MPNKNKRILTVEHLVSLFESNKISNFNYQDFGYKLSAQIPAKLIYEEESDSKNLYAKVRVCHTLLNRNGSYISEENMKKAMPSLKEYTPLLAYIHQLDDGTYDFHAHDVDFVEDEDGNVVAVYKESQIGTFTVDEPYLEYDEENDKTYVVAKVAIPREYTMAAEIIERKGGTKVSCELEIGSCSYNAKEKYLELEDFTFLACTCLGKEKNGKEIGEGMLGSRLEIEDFSVDNNSISNKLANSLKVVKTSNDELEGFDKKENQKGGMEVNKFEELLEKYSKTVEDVDFDYESMTDEELEVKFTELFEDEEASSEGTSDDDVEGNAEGNGSEDSAFDAKEEPDEEIVSYGKTVSDLENGNKQVSFEISHADVRYALYNLVSQFEELDGVWYYIEAVYDDHFVFSSWDDDLVYGCKYVKDGDNVSLDGERYRLYKELLTESEKAELESMRSNYSAIQERLNKYEKAEENAMKEAIFADETYAQYLETEEFKYLLENKEDYSVEELKDKAEIAFAKCVRKEGTFSVKNKKQNTSRVTLFSVEEDDDKNPYSTLFA